MNILTNKKIKFASGLLLIGALSLSVGLPALADTTVGTDLSTGGDLTVGGNSVMTGTLRIGSLSGIIQTIGGLLSGSTTLSTIFGGTGISANPSYGQLLVGNSLGGYTLTATSSLGITGGGGGSGTVNSGLIGQVARYNSAGTTLTGTSTLYVDSTGSVSVGSATSSTQEFSVLGNAAGSTEMNIENLSGQSGADDIINFGTSMTNSDRYSARIAYNLAASQLKLSRGGNFASPDLIIDNKGVTAKTFMVANGAAVTNRGYRFNTDNNFRWAYYEDDVPESGSNKGSDLWLTRFNDAGAGLGDIYYIKRDTGNTIFGTDYGLFPQDMGGTLQVQGTTRSQTSGNTYGLQVAPIYNQTSGSAANTDLQVNRLEDAIGSGTQLLADFEVASTSKASIDNTGAISGRVKVNNFTTTPHTLATPQSMNAYTNTGASALNVINLPTAAPNLTYTFVVTDTDGIEVVASTGDTIRIANSASATAGNIQSTTIGSTVTLLAVDTDQWIATASLGTWSVN